MRHYIYFSNEQDRENVTPELRCLVKAAICAALSYEDFRKSAEISVTFTDNDGIQEINREQRNVDAPTDVLSFPLGENGEYDINPETGAKMLGDIVISIDKVYEQAQEYGHAPLREFAFLVAHSMLHLLGYDHMEPDEAEVMEAKQEEILTKLGITR